MSADLLAALSRITLNLYSGARAIDAESFRVWALDGLAPHLPFIGAAWAYGVMTPNGAVFHDILIRGLSPQFADVVRQTASADPLSHKLAASSGRSFVHTRADYPEEVLRIAGDPDNLQCSLEGMIIDETSGLFGSVCLFRGRSMPAFAEPERRLHEALLPHWLEAQSQKLINDAFAKSSAARSAAATAVVRRNGAIEAISADFAALVRIEWPDWVGGTLPRPLLQPIGATSRNSLVGARVVARSMPLDERVLVQLRLRSPYDELGKREREVAELLYKGMSLKVVAHQLQVSPSTVESHRDHIYRKLAVSNRIGLIKALDESR